MEMKLLSVFSSRQQNTGRDEVNGGSNGTQANGNPPILKRTLRSWQIFFIVVGGVIGTGFFSGSSLILGVAGPGGALLAFSLVGTIVIAVMEGITEMILRWPIPNPLVEFVWAFADEELAIVIGIGYWYTFSVTFSALVIAALNLAEYWDISGMWKSICYIVIPLTLGAINFCQVEIFALLELIGGIVKLLLVIAIVMLLICLNLGAGGREPIHSKFLNDGLQHNANVASGQWSAVANAIPLAIFAYSGVELVTMTAFEARLPVSTSLGWPARHMAWIITCIYISTTFVFVLNVSWRDEELPEFYNQGISGLVSGLASGGSNQCMNSNTNSSNTEQRPKFMAPIIAVNNAGLSGGVLVACFIYSTISAANTGLFTASRALYGLTRDIRVSNLTPWWVRLVASMANVEPKTRSPWWAVFVSVFLLCWLPFIHLSNGYTLEELQQTLINMGSVSLVMVWTSQCLAYICFHYWRTHHARSLRGRYPSIQPSNDKSNLAFFQPALAWYGLISTLFIVFVLNSASMWNGHCVGVKFASAFISPLIFICLWLALKVSKIRRSIRRVERGQLFTWQNLKHAFTHKPSWIGVDLSDFRNFSRTIRHLQGLIHPDEVPAELEMEELDHEATFRMDGTRFRFPQEESSSVSTRGRHNDKIRTRVRSDSRNNHYRDNPIDDEEDDTQPEEFVLVNTSRDTAAREVAVATSDTTNGHLKSEDEHLPLDSQLSLRNRVENHDGSTQQEMQRQVTPTVTLTRTDTITPVEL